jgi:cell division protein FtsW (lipid II flippase)/serine/threonine protein phosphatase PrpC
VIVASEARKIRSSPLLTAFGASHHGLARTTNEDAYYCDPKHGVFIVVDGMGGHAAGEHAARIACERLIAELSASNGDSETRVREAITNANNEVFRESQEHPEWCGMACVLTVVLIADGKVTVGHVGDTRLYRLRGSEIERLTHDHSLVGALEESCSVTELEAMRHPRRNEVLRDVGTQERAAADSDFIDIYQFNFPEGDALLVCSDGLSDMLTAKQILEIAASGGNPERIVHDLIEGANDEGGKDNITVVYVTERSRRIELTDSNQTRDLIETKAEITNMATIYKRAAEKSQRRSLWAVLSFRSTELLGLLLASSAVVSGFLLVYQAKTTNPEKMVFSLVDDKLKTKEILNLNKVGDSHDLISALQSTLEDEVDRKFAAEKISDYVSRNRRNLDNVGGLSTITVDRKEIDANPSLKVFKTRLEAIREDEKATPPEKLEQPLKLLTNFSQLKPLFVVRTPQEFKSEFVLWGALAIFIFYAIHIVWRLRGFTGDGLLLPIVHLLSGLGLILMVTFRDPLRDTLSFRDFAIGLIVGAAALCAASLIDYQRFGSKLTWRPLFAAIILSVLLLLFGKGPGASDAKVNLWIFQPAEFVKVLLVFFLAGYFAENWEYMRELRQKGEGLLALLRRWQAPRLAEIVPVSIAMSAALLFFFFQRDLGPALIMGLTFVVLYAVARRRFTAALFGLLILGVGIWIGYKTATPLLVYQRIRIWLDIWDNGLRNGDQIAHAWWALSVGRFTGTGLGLGSPSFIPAGHTDLILASAGEELGFAGLAIILSLYFLLIGRCLRIARRAPSVYSLFLALGLTFIVAFEIVLITSGELGLFPLSGVVTPFLSFGKSSMIANFLIIGVVLSISARTGGSNQENRARFGLPLRVISLALCTVGVLLLGKAAYVQIWKADQNAITPVLTRQRDQQYRYIYNPRLPEALKLLPLGNIYDRNGIPLATSDWSELEKHRQDYENLGIDIEVACKKGDQRYYPFGLALFHILGDTRTKPNWNATNSDYIERDYAWRLRGFNDHSEKVYKTVFEIDQKTKTVTPREVEVLRKDYTDVLPLLQYRNRPSQSDYQALMQRERDVQTSIDVALQLKTAEVLGRQLAKQKLDKGAAVVLDASTGEVLAMVSYPLPPDGPTIVAPVDRSDDEEVADMRDQFLNRARYGLYPPGSTFKLVTAIAALRKDRNLATVSHDCKNLGDGRVGNYVKGWGRPVRDAEEDRAHNTISMEEGIIHSCNAFFGQLATYDVGAIDLWKTANLFEIKVANPNTAKMLADSLPWSAFGQGQVVASPFQMARVAATIANDGVMPYGKWVTDESNTRTTASLPILHQAENRIIARAMRGVVERGTAAKLKSILPAISGKTGTAELDSGALHSWFIGFASVSKARTVAFAVIVEGGGFGSAAAVPVAGEIVKTMKP